MNLILTIIDLWEVLQKVKMWHSCKKPMTAILCGASVMTFRGAWIALPSSNRRLNQSRVHFELQLVLLCHSWLHLQAALKCKGIAHNPNFVSLCFGRKALVSAKSRLFRYPYRLSYIFKGQDLVSPIQAGFWESPSWISASRCRKFKFVRHLIRC